MRIKKRKKLGSNWIAWDTETTGLDPYGTAGVDREYVCRPWLFTFCWPDGHTKYFEADVKRKTRKVLYSRALLSSLQEILADEKLDKWAHNSSFDRHMCDQAGIQTRGNFYCSKIAAQIAAPGLLNYALKPLCKKLFNMTDADEKDLKKSTIENRRLVKKAGDALVHEDVAADYHLADRGLAIKYGIKDAERVATLVSAFMGQATRRNLGLFLEEFELSKVLFSMEKEGMPIDRQRLAKLVIFYAELIEKYSAGIPEGLNIASPKQMCKLFFDELGMLPLKYSDAKCQHCKGAGCEVCKGAGRNPCCNADFLLSIKDENEIANTILHAKAATTLHNYLSLYSRLATHDGGCIGRLHPSYHQTDTQTNRLSCSNPNLQNIASPDSAKIRTEIPYRSREIFIANPGHVLYFPDYSQMEVWVLMLLAAQTAKKSGDKTLAKNAQQVIANLVNGDDAHQTIADLIYGDTYDATRAKIDQHKEQGKLSKQAQKNLKAYKSARKKAKNLQFCLIYGGGPGKIAEMMGCSIYEAREFIAEYKERLPVVGEFLHWAEAEAKQKGVVQAPFNAEYVTDPGFEYRMVNYLIQGTSARLMKRAMIRLHKFLENKKARLIVQIHDEVGIEVHGSEHSKQLMRDVVRIMGEDHKHLGCPVPFPVGMKLSKKSWADAIEVEL